MMASPTADLRMGCRGRRSPLPALLALLVVAAAPPAAAGARSTLMLAGSDRDENGCIGSAGYSWCPTLETPACVRVWETPCPPDGAESTTAPTNATAEDAEASTETPIPTSTPGPTESSNVCQVAAPTMGICTADLNPCGFPSFCSCPAGYTYHQQLGPSDGCLLDGVRGFDEVVPGERQSDECVVPIGATVGSDGLGRCTFDIVMPCGGSSNCQCPPGYKFASQIQKCLRGDL